MFHLRVPLLLSLILALSAFTVGCKGGAGAEEPTTDSADTDGTGDGEEDEDWLEGDWDDDAPEGGTDYHGSAIEQLGISGPDTPWAEMGHDEREFYMIGRVLPITHEIFERHDAERYADFTCVTCHGENGEAEGYHMPTSSIMQLAEPDSQAWRVMEMTQGDMVTFMRDEVTPIMGTLMGAEEGSYSCFHCHQRQGQ